jgi:BirA family biotin operon repressor/biotin-[acetyl-CoA-carboxylase] ligase
MISEQTLRKGLLTRRFGQKVFTFDEIDSTNTCAKVLAECWAEEGTVVLAEYQTAGRGRLGRSWQSETGQNLMFSLVLRPSAQPEALNLLPLLVAVAVSRGIEQATGLRPECKWPNDLLLNRKKTAGILMEGSLKDGAIDYVVAGVGINVNQPSFGGELAAKATSLRIECGRETDRIHLLREVLSQLETLYDEAAEDGFAGTVPLWLSLTSMVSKQVTLDDNGTVFSGIVKGVSPGGALILQCDDGERTLFAGDVTIVG